MDASETVVFISQKTNGEKIPETPEDRWRRMSNWHLVWYYRLKWMCYLAVLVSVFVGASVTFPSIFSVCLLSIGVYGIFFTVVSCFDRKFFFCWNPYEWETSDWRNPIYVLERRHEIENADDLKSIRQVIITKKQVDFWVKIGFISKPMGKKLGPLIEKICEHDTKLNTFKTNVKYDGDYTKQLQNQLNDEATCLLKEYLALKETMLSDMPNPQANMFDLI